MIRYATVCGLIAAACVITAAAFRAGSTDAAASDTAPPATQPAGQCYVPVVTPNGVTLPYRLDNGVKVFELTAERIKHELAPGVVINAWGYNGRTPGPTIEAVEGDRVRILVTNKLPEETSIHWHGIIVPNGMDGVAGLTQPAIRPGETFAYEFTLKQHGTFMYHPHFDEMTQIAMGMMGFFIIHPRDPNVDRVDRDFAIFLHEWAIAPGATGPDPTVMLDFNYFTFNGKLWPATEPLVVRTDQKVRIRLANLSMDSHPIHIHGVTPRITGASGGPIPDSAQQPASTVNVPPGDTRDMVFLADNPGDWALHCHKTHHTMSGMAHGLPNVIGMDASEADRKIRQLLPQYMTMGQGGMGGMRMPSQVPNFIGMGGGEGPFGFVDMSGMFTVIKVRDGITGYQDPGWYRHPPGTVAWRVAPAQKTQRK